MTVNLFKQHKESAAKMNELEDAVTAAARQAGLDEKLIELVRIRVSQINGCAYCLRSHTRAALTAGESTDRLGVLVAWREAQCFTAEEVAALEIAERVNACNTAEFDYAPLTDEQISAISWIVVTMNSWNRLALHSGLPVA